MSKALNNSGTLSADTRARIVRIAGELGFRPNDLAQALHRGQSFTVGLISNDSFGRFTLPILEGLERELAAQGIAIFMCNATDDPARERQHIEQLMRKQVDGLIFTARRADRRPEVSVPLRDLPAVFVFSRSDDPHSLCLLPDDEGGARLATAHLLATGRRRIAYVTGPEHFEAVRLRRDGYRAALAEAGLEPADGHVLTGPWSEQAGAVRRSRCCSATRRPRRTAIFAATTRSRAASSTRLRDRGIAVPGAIGVVGFDNWDVMVEAARPRLTSVDMNLYALGREAGRQIVRLIGGEAVQGVLRLPCTLVVRESCGATTGFRKAGAAECAATHPSTSPRSRSPATSGASGWRPCSAAPSRASTPSSKREGCSKALLVLDPPPPLRIPRRAERLHHADLLGQRHRQVDRGGELRAAPPPRRRRSRRRSTTSSTKLEKAQLPDGYLNLWYIGREIENRWTNLRDNHELYNCGHMLEGAIAYFQATGRRRMLDVMERYLDHIRATFGTGPGQKRGYCGHQEIEIALIKLYHLTGEKKQLDLAAYFIDERGPAAALLRHRARRPRRGDPAKYGQGTYEYSQSHKPVREQDKVVGHAVRAMYMYTAMADLAAELGDEALKRACEVLWRDVTSTPDVRDRRLRPLGARTRASPPTTTCRTTPPMPRPAPRSR